jgi:hypothetical protein
MTKQIVFNSIEIDGIDYHDYPDFVDAYPTYAEYEDGTPLTEDELNNIDSQLMYDRIMEIIY